jgi:hypothetical protein
MVPYISTVRDFFHLQAILRLVAIPNERCVYMYQWRALVIRHDRQKRPKQSGLNCLVDNTYFTTYLIIYKYFHIKIIY